MKKQSTISRRTFLSSAAIAGTTSALGVGGLLTSCSGSGDKENKYTPLRPAGEVYIPVLGDKANDGKPLRAGIIGCGARGTGAAFNFLEAGDGLSIVACADVFMDKVERCRAKLKEKNVEIADNMCFDGFDSYKKVCEADLDVVLIASPQLFHPEHLKYAIEQGKHAFCEKPAAIDSTGFRTFMMAVKQAQAKGLCIVPGTHNHYNRGYIESYKLVQEGYIGRIISANLWFCQGDIGYVHRRPEWTDMEFMLRDFFNWCWLSGDHVVDQFIHAIDIFTWFSHLKPERVIGIGSRQRRFSGDIYDNFSMDYEYEGGVIVRGMARQIDGCGNRVAETIHGTKGSWNSTNNRTFNILDLDGNVVWEYDEEAAKQQYKQHNPYVLEHVDLVNSIRSGKALNKAEFTANSSMACIMARESAYTGKICTWDEVAMSDMNFMPEKLTGNVDMSKFKVPVPGKAPSLVFQGAGFWQ